MSLVESKLPELASQTPEADILSNEKINERSIVDGITRMRETLPSKTIESGADTITLSTRKADLGENEPIPVEMTCEVTSHPSADELVVLRVSAATGEAGTMTAPVENSVVELPFIPLLGKKKSTFVQNDQRDHSGNPQTEVDPSYSAFEQVGSIDIVVKQGRVEQIAYKTIHGESQRHYVEDVFQLEKEEPDNLNVRDAAQEVRSVLKMVGGSMRNELADASVQETRTKEVQVLGEQAKAVDAARRLVDSSAG